MTPHPNAMTYWNEIRCQRGHDAHASVLTNVKLGGPHGYGDYPEVPARLARSFQMYVWDPNIHPVDGGPYCPAHDAVSETIITHNIWEPRETILALDALQPDGGIPPVFVDFGAQVGWFTLLAASSGAMVLGVEADETNRDLLAASVALNGWEDGVVIKPWRVGPDTPVLTVGDIEARRVALAKIDIEGAERDAIRMLQPLIEGGYVERLLVEVSPVFDSYYPDLVAELVDAGYRAYTLPGKLRPPVSFEDPAEALAPFRIDDLGTNKLKALVAGWHQEDVWFVREDLA